MKSSFVSRGYDDIAADSSPQVVYRPDMVIDDMAFDPFNNFLYWTASDQGLIARLNLNVANASHEVVVSGLNQPKSIAIDVKDG